MTHYVKEPTSEIEQLKRENELKTGLVSLLSHNLKENLGSLLQLIEGVDNDIISEEVFFNLLPQVRQDTQKNLQTVTDTEHWLKTQLGHFEPRQSSLSAQELFSELKGEFEQKLADKQLDFQFKGDKTIGLQNDRFLVVFSFQKILDNAIKYSHPGDAIYLEASAEGEQIVLSITDFGTGIDPEQKESLFSFQSPVTKGTQGEIGAGLGLKIVKNFIVLIGGEIEVNSSENTGTQVAVTLPQPVK